MKKLIFTSNNEVLPESNPRYKFSEEEKKKYIYELRKLVKNDMLLNESNEIKSIECASKFITTSS